MIEKDEFDDPRAGGNVSSIFRALDIRERIQGRSKLLTLLPLAGVVVLVAAVIWFSYPRGGGEDITAVPVIRADASEYKTTPADRGGMEIPYRDSTVFDTLKTAQNDKDGGRVENLLPPAEKPIAREELFAADDGAETPAAAGTGKADTDVASSDDTASPDQTAVTEENDAVAPAMALPPAAAPDATEVQPIDTAALPQPEPVSEPAATPAPVKAEVKAVAATEPAAGAAGGSHYVQLGSLRSRDAAQASWKKTQTDFPAQFSSLTLRVQEAEVAGKGTFYRVQAGPVSESKAKAICSTVQAKQPGGCIVVKP